MTLTGLAIKNNAMCKLVAVRLVAVKLPVSPRPPTSTIRSMTSGG